MFIKLFDSLKIKLYQGFQKVRQNYAMAPLVGLEPTTYRLTAERSTNWANGEYLNLATTYFLSRVTHKYRRHIGAWLLCSVWEQVFPPCNHHQKCLVYFHNASCITSIHSKIYRESFLFVNFFQLFHSYILTFQLI